MSSLNKRIMLVAIILALITTGLTYFYMHNMNNNKEKASKILIYIAKVDIPARTTITDEMIEKIDFPVIAGVTIGTSDKSKLVGKLTKERIIKGEPIQIERLNDSGKNSMSYLIPKGMRAVTIAVNEVSEVANFIKTGDYVDIVATLDEKEKTMGSSKLYYPKYTKIILQNVQILGIGQSMGDENKELKKLPLSVTLAVSPSDTEKVIFADENGVLRLVLRPASDKNIETTNGIVRDDVVAPKSRLVLP